VAAVVLIPGATIAEDELVEWTNQRVGAKYQRIREVIIRDEFPRTVAGKTLKRRMRSEYRPR
jgi:acyl-CoA synthetase (AMP-forming)/AMP-acid ligase II